MTLISSNLTRQPRQADNDDVGSLDRIAAGDRQSLSYLYLKYHHRLSRFLRRVTYCEDAIEEAINDTFLVVWQKAREFRGEAQVSTWIMGIAYRTALKSLRRTGQALWEKTAPAGDMPLACPFDDHEVLDWVAKGLILLPFDQRVTLEMTYWMGYSQEEIAEIMECPVSTIKSRMFRARLTLRNTLPKLGGFLETRH
ncbi:RNA polymerase sigma factor [Collimonas fungivorans]|uniref:RNA polymerase sigma-E factor n=1 Tax=Collimonas fungivorans (strain Ter331) TaxID=1005048 RepID=G0AFQ2_COLFT|nr:RNA polymerase sigma factor [Collimonas fungivorans]AEK64141.1 RNA polymerase sigma-E factor [Collimonas fungivorans Ter331]